MSPSRLRAKTVLPAPMNVIFAMRRRLRPARSVRIPEEYRHHVRSSSTALHADGWGTPQYRNGSNARAIGILLVVQSLFLAFFLATFGWGGFWYMSLAVRAIGIGAVATLFVGGLALFALGCSRRRSC
jgi:hypothetical protein